MRKNLRDEMAKESAEALAAGTTMTETNTSITRGENVGDMVGDFDTGDVRLPALNLVQSVGMLSGEFTPGDLLHNKETVLASGHQKETSASIELTVVSVLKRYIENTDFESKIMPRYLDTMEQVRAEDGTCDYGPDDQRPSWLRHLTCLVLIKGTNETPGFDYVHEEDCFAPAIWQLKGSSYTRAGKAIITKGRMAANMGRPLTSCKWTLATRRELLGDNWVFCPVLRGAGRNKTEFCDWISETGLSL